MLEFDFKNPPFAHQAKILHESTEQEYTSLFLKPGLGKTFIIINQIAYHFVRGNADMLVVVAPNGVHRMWADDEIPLHMPDAVMKQTRTFVWHSSKSKTKKAEFERDALLKHKGLAVLLVAYEATITPMFKAYMKRVFAQRKVFMTLDESHRIKGRNAKVKLTLVAMGAHAKYRRILTGTPTEVPPDVWSQLKYLKSSFWRDNGFPTSTEFDAYFCVQKSNPFARGPRAKPLTVGYKNLEVLQKLVAKTGYSMTLEDAGIHLPPLTYSKRYYEMFPEQRRIYENLTTEFRHEFNDGLIVDCEAAITRLLRLQQVVCGYLGTGPGEPIRRIDEKKNPRLELLVDEILADLPHQALVWGKFREDISQIADALGKECLRYDGSVDNDGRAAAKAAFQAGDIKYLVMSSAGAEGLTLTTGKTCCFYSNSYSAIKREQMEGRCVLHGSPVLTPGGWVPIQDIKTGDVVIGKSGRPRKVLDAWYKGATKNLVSVSVKGWPTPITTTCDHNWLLQSGEWIEAERLRPGDMLAQPLTDDLPGQEHLLFPENLRPGTTGINSYNSPWYITAPSSIPLDEETLFMLGYFAGDGFTRVGKSGGRCIGFAGNTTTKKEAIARITAWFESRDLKVSHRNVPNSTGTEIRTYGAEMAIWFRHMFGADCHSKQLPDMDLSTQQCKWLLSGLSRSDGYTRKGRMEYSTVSKKLASQVFWLMTRCGYKPCFVDNTATVGNMLVSCTYDNPPGFKVARIEMAAPNKGPDGKRQKVYDLSIEWDKSFVLGGCVVHNCHRIGQKDPVHVIDIICEGTVDNDIVTSLRNKFDLQSQLTGDKFRRML